MKKTIFTLAMLCCTIMGNAQVTDEISAILQVGDNAQIFYGADAYAQALETAPDAGGVITLSSGTFNAAEISKSVAVYGAGWVTENSTPTTSGSDNSLKATSITGVQTISASGGVYMEGLRFEGNLNVTKAIDGLDFVKCWWYGKNLIFAEQNDNVTFTQCYIYCEMNKLHKVLFQNCWIYFSWTYNLFSAESDVVINHCLLADAYGSYTVQKEWARFRCLNSMVFTGDYKNPVQTYQYCTIDKANLDGYTGSSDNWFSVSDNKGIFADQNNKAYSDTRTFELSDEAKATYIGSDGTQVGINGGNYPWNKTPHTPLVTDLKVTIDGTNLKVTYNAETR